MASPDAKIGPFTHDDVALLGIFRDSIAAWERSPKPNILNRSVNFLKGSAAHYLESISPRGKDLRLYAAGALTGIAATALVYALPDGPQHLWVIPVTAGLWKGVATTAITGILSYKKYRGYLSEVEQKVHAIGVDTIGEAEGITVENQAQRIEQLALGTRQLARERNRVRTMTQDQFTERLQALATSFVAGDNSTALTQGQQIKIETVVETMAEELKGKEDKYKLFKSKMASFTGGMAAATLAMNLTNFAVYKFTGAGLGQRVHEALSSPSPEPTDTAVPPTRTPVPSPTAEASPTAPPPPSPTAAPPVETIAPPPPAPAPEAAALAPPADIKIEGAVQKAIASWQQAQEAGVLPTVDQETLDRAAEVGSHATEIDSTTAEGIKEAIQILRENGLNSPSGETIQQVQERILHLAEDLANSSDLPSAGSADYKEAYANLLNAHLDQFQTIARQALIETQPAAMEKLTAFHSYTGSFDSLALLQAAQEQDFSLDIFRGDGDTARIFGTIYGGFDIPGHHINYIDVNDWSNRLTTTIKSGDRKEIEAFIRFVGVSQENIAPVSERLLSGDSMIFEQMIQALGGTSAEKKAVVERIIAAASRNDPDAIKILRAIGHWKRSTVLNIPANIKFLLEYKYGLKR